MKEQPIYFVYRITNLLTNKHYYGSKTSKDAHPDMLGSTYLSSSLDKNFINEQKEHPEHFKYKVIMTFDDKDKCLEMECKLHERFDVGVNESFYNRCKQTTTTFIGNGIFSDEHKRKLSENHADVSGNKNPSKKPGVGDKIRKSKLGIPRDNLTKKKISESNKGKIAWNKGKPRSEKTKEKLRKRVTCPYCNLTGGISVMKRYHFDNCKLKKS